MRPELGGPREKGHGRGRGQGPCWFWLLAGPSRGAFGTVRQTLPRQKLCLESSSFRDYLVLRIITSERLQELQNTSIWVVFFQPPFPAGVWESFSSFSLFHAMKQVSFPGASADSGLLCLGFQHRWGFSVCKIFSPWDKSWKPDISEPRPSLSLE